MQTKFICPQCMKPATYEHTIGDRRYSTEVLWTPYFICNACRLIFIDKRLVRGVVKEWWQRNNLLRYAPFTYFYDDAIKYLRETVLPYFLRIGYKEARFIKREKGSADVDKP